MAGAHRRIMDEKNTYWIFDKEDFIEMWDDWWKGKVDPRKGSDIDQYRQKGRMWILRPRHVTTLILTNLVTDIVLGTIVWLKL